MKRTKRTNCLMLTFDCHHYSSFDKRMVYYARSRIKTLKIYFTPWKVKEVFKKSCALHKKKK